MKAPPAGPRERHLAQAAQAYRYKLIPTQGRCNIRYVYGRDEALSEAREQFKATDIPVMVVAYPEDHVDIHTVAVVGGKQKRGRR